MLKKDIAIIGSGGLAKEVRWLLEECNKVLNCWNILGWVSKDEPGISIAGLPVLGDDDWLVECKVPIDVAVGVGSGILRKKIITRLKQNENISFPIIISPSAELSDTVKMGEGSIVCAKSIITVDITIGSFFFCNLASTIGHECLIDDFVTLNPGVNISGNVKLGELVTIGTGATVIQGITVGSNTIIGAGATVIRDLPPDCTAVGVPARILEK